MKLFFVGLLTGAFTLTTVEYFKAYNLLDFTKDHLQALVGHLHLKLADLPAALIVVALFVGLIVLVARS